MSARLDLLPAVGLADVMADAARQTRTDRKYVVPADLIEQLIERSGARVLEIDGRRTFRYRSTYFDTPEFASYLGAAHRRPGRFKVRTRTYADEGATWLEVKLRTRRHQTDKHRVLHHLGDDTLGDEGREFVARFDRVGGVVDRLEPVVTTEYERSTLVLAGDRVTIDCDVRCRARGGPAALIRGVIVETKTAGRPGSFDRLLWSFGERPCKISKFALGLATAVPELPANKWHRTLLRHVEVA